ncbi:hypothetical protein EHYA_03699 [Embleya hyalina]|uniref:Lipoprotein n=1 Tax=Embleya hyalina TaxID=516124 RepID=A0A401YN37_9ACTN|nr:hypothetical protein EHYA_03699 [Embleya hyalina]
MLSEERVHLTRPATAAALLLLLVAACDTAPATTPTRALDPALAANRGPLPDAGPPGAWPSATTPLGATAPATPANPAGTVPPDPRRAGAPADARSTVPSPSSRGAGGSDRADHSSTSGTSARHGQPDRGTSKAGPVDPWAACDFGFRFSGRKDDAPEARVCRSAHG